MNNMNTPRTRTEFERNFHLLHQQIEDGKFHIPHNLSRSMDGLARVRFLPNGRIDFLSVDESARLSANMMNQFSNGGAFEGLMEEHQSRKGSADPEDGESTPLASERASD